MRDFEAKAFSHLWAISVDPKEKLFCTFSIGYKVNLMVAHVGSRHLAGPAEDFQNDFSRIDCEVGECSIIENVKRTRRAQNQIRSLLCLVSVIGTSASV